MLSKDEKAKLLDKLIAALQATAGAQSRRQNTLLRAAGIRNLKEVRELYDFILEELS